MPTNLMNSSSLKTGANDPEFYYENELQIGATLNIFGRAVLLCDCDDFTKTYYNTKYGVQDFTPIPFPDVCSSASSAGLLLTTNVEHKTADSARSAAVQWLWV